jgi:hypothetical protein
VLFLYCLLVVLKIILTPISGLLYKEENETFIYLCNFVFTMVDTQQIRVEPKIKKALDKLKKVPQEPYNSVIERSLEELELLKKEA